jgi:hypothetical protein
LISRLPQPELDRVPLAGETLLSLLRMNFRQLPIAEAVRHKLASIDESREQHPDQKMALAGKLLHFACDRARGIYVPLSSHMFLKAKLTEDFASVPKVIRADLGTKLCLFGNPLLLPADFDQPQFDIGNVVKPSLRATNAGFLVATVEYDCQSRDQFAQIVGWLSSRGEFKEVDTKLRQFCDYAGYCVVLAGNRSLHFHFTFDTRHLTASPYDQSFDIRSERQDSQAAVMSNVHHVYWKTAADLMAELLAPPIPADNAMASYTQLRRMPWGLRKLDKTSNVLGLPKGTVVPQLVVSESIRAKRSSKGSNKFIVASDFSVSHYVRARKQTSGAASTNLSAGQDMVNELASMCRSEWRSDFPKPLQMIKNGGEWIIQFQNHAIDRTPSTVARGDFNTLLVLGQNAPAGPFILPDGLSANEIGDHLARRFGLEESRPQVSRRSESKLPHIERLKAHAGKPFKQFYEESASWSFPHVSSCPVPKLQAIYRQKLAHYFNHAMFFKGDIICVSPEGIGKTWALFDLMQLEALDTAMQRRDAKTRFFVFAFRSRAQAEEKAAEYATENRRAFVLKPFWAHYQDACNRRGVKPILKEEFDEQSNILSVLNHIARIGQKYLRSSSEFASPFGSRMTVARCSRGPP